MADELWLMTENDFKSGTQEELIALKELDKLFPQDLILFNPKSKQFEINN